MHNSPIIHERIANIDIIGLLLQVKITPCHASSSGPHDSNFAEWQRFQILVENVNVIIGYWATNRHRDAGNVRRSHGVDDCDL